MKNTGSVFVALSELFVRFPIWCFLIYVMLKAANPDRLVWFLFFVYVPLGIINLAIGTIINLTKKESK